MRLLALTSVHDGLSIFVNPARIVSVEPRRTSKRPADVLPNQSYKPETVIEGSLITFDGTDEGTMIVAEETMLIARMMADGDDVLQPGNFQ